MRQTRRVRWAAAAAVLFGAATVLAVHQDNFLELGPGSATDEGGVTNILGDGNAANGPDWADLFDAAGVFNDAFGGTGAFVKDDVSAGNATDATAFPKAGSDKNSDTIAEWNWQSASVPSKDDVTNAYAYTVMDTSFTPAHMIIYAGAEREDPSGTSHLDIEFFQNTVALSEAPPCDAGPCTFTGTNKDGDLLVSMDYTNGGAFAGLSIRKRSESANKDHYTLITSLGGEGCNAATTGLPADSVCAFANGGPIDGGPWDNFDNHGAIITTLQTNAFTEFGVDVTAALGFTPCFSTVMVKTRSAGSFTAELKDFSLHAFEQCNASAATQIHSGATVGASHTATDIQNTSVAVGTTVHDKAIITGTPGFATPTGTVTFLRYTNGSCTAPPVASVPADTVTLAQTSPGIAAAESPSFTTTSAGSISFKAHYNGDTNYPATDSPCEPLTVNQVNSAVNTDIRQNNVNGSSVLNTHVQDGTTLVDVATVTGSAPGNVDPTGTVTFLRYTTADCSGTAAATDQVALSGGTANDGTATAVSPTYTTTADAGEFVSFKVIYSGDSVFFPSTATLCEPICSFTNSPTIPTTP